LTSGWILLHKPPGISSAQALRPLQRALPKNIKIGHGGTLDPLADGALVIAIGEGTKLVHLALKGEKSYILEVTWGEERTTDDQEGDVLFSHDFRPTKNQILEALPHFIGHIQQVPPVYSALKKNGKRLCDLARSGEIITPDPRTVEIISFDLCEILNHNVAQFHIRCGGGAYMRSLARDMGRFLGTYGYASRITRTSVGPFHLDQSIPWDRYEDACAKGAWSDLLYSVTRGLDDILAVVMDEDEVFRLQQGQPLPLEKIKKPPSLGEQWLVCSPQGIPIALVRRDDRYVYPVRGFCLTK
jgi:tRNA pseudouridine55 synthase